MIADHVVVLCFIPAAALSIARLSTRRVAAAWGKSASLGSLMPAHSWPCAMPKLSVSLRPILRSSGELGSLMPILNLALWLNLACLFGVFCAAQGSTFMRAAPAKRGRTRHPFCCHQCAKNHEFFLAAAAMRCRTRHHYTSIIERNRAASILLV